MEDAETFDLFDYHYKSNHEILLSYKGPFRKDVISIIAEYIKVIIGKKPNLGKKVLKIFLELAQNVSYYSDEVNILVSEENFSCQLILSSVGTAGPRAGLKKHLMLI